LALTQAATQYDKNLHYYRYNYYLSIGLPPSLTTILASGRNNKHRQTTIAVPWRPLASTGGRKQK